MFVFTNGAPVQRLMVYMGWTVLSDTAPVTCGALGNLNSCFTVSFFAFVMMPRLDKKSSVEDFSEITI